MAGDRRIGGADDRWIIGVAVRTIVRGDTSKLPRRTRTFTLKDNAVRVACLYVGLTGAIPQYTAIDVGPITVGLVLTGVIAMLGWRALPSNVHVRRYVLAAFLLATWTGISAIAAWRQDVLYEAVVNGIWLVFLVPGLAGLMRDAANRHAMLTGWFFGVGYYVVVAAYRELSGKELFDVVQGTIATHRLLDLSRGGVNSVALVILPFLLVGAGGPLMRAVRWPIAGLIGYWIVVSGARSGILGLGVVLLVLAVVQPRMSRTARRVMVAVLVGYIAFAAMQAAGGRFTESTDRLVNYFNDEKTDSDRARELLLRKAWHLAIENPAFGVGPGRFIETYHPVIEEAQTHHVKEIALNFDEHNTFAGTLAETGFPGLFAFVAVLFVLLIAGFSERFDPVCRAAMASVAGLAFTIAFHHANGPRLYVPMAFLLACVASVRGEDQTSTSRERPTHRGAASLVDNSSESLG